MPTKTLTTLPELKTQGADLVSWWHSVEESKTEILKRLAAIVVDIRAQFTDEETGQPDWRGKTWDYRQFMTEMYESAQVPPASVSGVQSSLRYHVGNRLREIVPAEALAGAGMLAEGPKERMERHRTEADVLWKALQAPDPQMSTEERREAYRTLLDAAATIAERAELMAVDRLTKRDAVAAHRQLVRSIESLQKLEHELKGRIS